ncbi:MAG: 3-dehydroquinate synthase [Polyangiaceae bacterium]
MQPRRPIILSGPIGAGKTTLGRALTEGTAETFVDVDERIEQAAGKEVSAIFREEGEPAFRALEERVALECVHDTHHSVVALGGGAILSPAVRAAALARGFLVTLDAPADVRAARIRGGPPRPLLPTSPASAERHLERLASARSEFYAECHARISTSDRSVADLVREIRRESARDLLVVPLGSRTYRVELAPPGRESNDPCRTAAHVVASLSPSSVVLVTDAHVADRQHAYLDALTKAIRVPVSTVVLSPGEENKGVAAVSRVWDEALRGPLDRDALVLAVGGGVVSDVAGFAAATLLRGLRWVSVPTTLLAMVDASVGGKTGVDHATGKNRIGAFHQPSHVVIDLTLLETQEDRDFRAGMGELVKMALLSGPPQIDALRSAAPSLLAREPNALRQAVSTAIADKIRIVSADERDRGPRMVLNLGHTVGHALEAAGGYTRLLHGEAVGLGLLLEHRFAASRGLAGPSVPVLLSELLGQFGLPTAAEPALVAQALAHLGADKKRKGRSIALPLAMSPGNVVVREVDIDELSRGLTP